MPTFYLPATAPLKLEVTPLETALAIDLVISVMHAFRDSQSLAAHNIWNLYMGEELRDALPQVIVNSCFT